jgi:antitoxin (DNA-binding transcriptional repressor) of toxin-antitoxin stability system
MTVITAKQLRKNFKQVVKTVSGGKKVTLSYHKTLMTLQLADSQKEMTSLDKLNDYLLDRAHDTFNPNENTPETDNLKEYYKHQQLKKYEK